jgi:hypothetical protein
MRRTLFALTILSLTFATIGQADKKDKAKGHDKDKSGAAEHHGSSVAVAVDIFIGGDREIIREYVDHYPGGGLPPGLAKRGGNLPPGLEKQLRKKGKLPPGLRKKLTAFPPELEARLCPLQPNLKRGFVEGRAVIFSDKTSVVLDVFIPF